MVEVVLKDSRQKSLTKDSGVEVAHENGFLELYSSEGSLQKRLHVTGRFFNYWIDCENQSILVEVDGGRTYEILFTKEEFEKFFKPPSSKEWGEYFFFLHYVF